MKIYYISIFPEIYESFLNTSLIKKAQDKGLIQFEIINPRNWTENKHNQIDDEIYGGGHGMLMMAKPIIDSIEHIIETKMKDERGKIKDYKIIYLSPSKNVFNQELAYKYSKTENIIIVSGRYEGIDHRFVEYFEKKYPNNFETISIGQYIIMGGETASMVMTESITRLIPGVIKEANSHINDSYSPQKNLANLEHPQYTRPSEVYGIGVPEILLSGHDAKIEKWKEDNEKLI